MVLVFRRFALFSLFLYSFIASIICKGQWEGIFTFLICLWIPIFLVFNLLKIPKIEFIKLILFFLQIILLNFWSVFFFESFSFIFQSVEVLVIISLVLLLVLVFWWWVVDPSLIEFSAEGEKYSVLVFKRVGFYQLWNNYLGLIRVTPPGPTRCGRW